MANEMLFSQNVPPSGAQGSKKAERAALSHALRSLLIGLPGLLATLHLVIKQ